MKRDFVGPLRFYPREGIVYIYGHGIDRVRMMQLDEPVSSFFNGSRSTVKRVFDYRTDTALKHDRVWA